MFPGARHYSVLARSASGSSYTFIMCKIQEKSIGVNEKTPVHLTVCPGRSITRSLLGPVRESLTPSLYAKNEICQILRVGGFFVGGNMDSLTIFGRVLRTLPCVNKLRGALPRALVVRRISEAIRLKDIADGVPAKYRNEAERSEDTLWGKSRRR